MATPVERRNFVAVVPVAKKRKLGPIFFLNIRVVYKLSVKKQETGQITGKNPPKKGVFIRPSDQLAEFGLKSCQLLGPGLKSWQLLGPGGCFDTSGSMIACSRDPLHTNFCDGRTDRGIGYSPITVDKSITTTHENTPYLRGKMRQKLSRKPAMKIENTQTGIEAS